MLTGTDSMWWLWLGFFREHFAAFVSLLVLLPLSMFLNWRLATAADHPLRGVRGADRAGACAAPKQGQSEVERHYSDLAERASDALGNVALVQSFARIEAEVGGIRGRRHQAARRADAGAVVVGDLRGADARLDHAHRAVDLRGRHLAQHPRAHDGRRDRHLHELRRAGDQPARSGRGLRQPPVAGRAAAARSSSRSPTPCPPCATGPTRSIPAACAAWSNSPTCRSPTTASGRRSPTSNFTALPGEIIALVGSDRRRQVDGARAPAPRVRSAVRHHQDRRHGHPRPQARAAPPQHRRGVPGGAAVQPLDRGEPARRQARRHRRGNPLRGRARAGARFHREQSARASRRRSASAGACCPAASASGCRSRARS